MKDLKKYKLVSLALMLAYVLSACSGVPAGPGGQSPQNGQSQEVVFSGTVEAIGAGQWTVSGQSISLSSTTAVGANIQVGDTVKVEAVVDQDGTVTAVRIESAGAEDAANANSNDNNTNTSNSNDGSATDNASSSNDGLADNSGSDTSNTNENTATGPEQEMSGTVQAVTTESITINGVTYMISDLTEFKDLIAVGDSVQVHVIVNEDGTFTILEIKKSTGAGNDDNSNSNGSDDNSNDANENGDSNDGNSNGDDDNANDDGGDDDHNENDSGSNDNG